MNKNKIIPIDYFEYEKDFMTKIIPHTSEPYRQHNRVVGQEGFVLLGTNLFWASARRDSNVTVLEYADRIVIYQNRKVVCEHTLPPFGIREKKFKPDGITVPYRPKKTTVPPHDEDRKSVV